MKRHSSAHKKLHLNLDLPSRVALVLSAYKELGYINRKALMQIYAVSELQAGALMRDFIHANARNIEWDVSKSHYKMTN